MSIHVLFVFFLSSDFIFPRQQCKEQRQYPQNKLCTMFESGLFKERPKNSCSIRHALPVYKTSIVVVLLIRSIGIPNPCISWGDINWVYK